MRAPRARVFREFSLVRGGPIRSVVRSCPCLVRPTPRVQIPARVYGARSCEYVTFYSRRSYSVRNK